MYLSFFNLKREPFSVAADPRFLYMSPSHRTAAAHLHYGLRRGAAVILLTGEIGAGKTTVCRLFLRQLPATDDVAFVVNPRLEGRALLARVCQDLHIDVSPDTHDLIDAIHGHLLLAYADGRRTLIVVDEAQALSLDAFEQLRLLTNLDSSGGKLQVFLIGQPELRTMLQAPALEAMAQRVVARFHLPALPVEETARYIAHRLSIAGRVGDHPFHPSAVLAIHRLCRGVPRRINVLCDRAMHVAAFKKIPLITSDMVEAAAADVFDTVTVPAESVVATAVAAPVAAAPPTIPAAALAAVPTPTVPPAAPPQSRWPLWAAVIGTACVVAAGVAAAMLSLHDRQPLARIVAQTPGAPSQPVAQTTPAPGGVAAPAPGEVAAPAPVAPARAVPAPGVPSVVTPPRPAPPVAAESLQRGDADAVLADAPTDEWQGWRVLGRLWGVRLDTGDPCAMALKVGLRCYRATGGITTIRQMNRPGLFKLLGRDGRVVFAVLTGLDGDAVTFRRNKMSQTVALADLAGLWHGEFLTFWRPPAGYVPGVVMDEHGALANWLEHELPVVDGPAAGAGDAGKLAPRLAAFQLTHGLDPDGRAGPLTLMQIGRAAGIDEPQLQIAR